MTTLYVTDLCGQEIEVTDLRKAIKQAAMFKDFMHCNSTHEISASDDQLQKYWIDLHNKLLLLAAKLKKTKNK